MSSFSGTCVYGWPLPAAIYHMRDIRHFVAARGIAWGCTLFPTSCTTMMVVRSDKMYKLVSLLKGCCALFVPTAVNDNNSTGQSAQLIPHQAFTNFFVNIIM